MTYTITVKPSQTPGKVTATSSDGGARYWLSHNADPAATITTTWSSGPGHYALRSTISNAASLTVMGDRFQKAKQSRIPAPPMR
jgi:purine nucleoside permease